MIWKASAGAIASKGRKGCRGDCWKLVAGSHTETRPRHDVRLTDMGKDIADAHGLNGK